MELEINRAHPTSKSENLQCAHADQRPKKPRSPTTDWRSRDVDWGRNGCSVDTRQRGRVSDALMQRMTIKLAGADDMKQQGWLSKIVPPPKEATAHVSSKDPGRLVVAEQTLMMRYQCLHPARSALPKPRRLLPPRKGRVQRVSRGRTATGADKRFERRGGSDAGAASCLDEANHSRTLELGKA